MAPAFKNLVPDLNTIAHDFSKTIISIEKLDMPQNKKVFDIQFYYPGETPDPKSKTYKISIQYIRTIDSDGFLKYCAGKNMDYDSSIIIRALNIILAKFPSSGLTPNKKIVNFGQSRFFIVETQPDDLGSGLVAYRGYYSSVRPTFGKILCNINVCTAAFFKPQNLGVMINEVFGGRGGNPKGGIVYKSIDGLRVSTTYLGKPKIHTLKGIGGSAEEEKFFWEKEKKTVSVAYYYSKEYKLTLLNPLWRCGFYSLRNGQKAFIPAELCTIVEGQIFTSFLTGDQTSTMLQIACRSPKTNAELITNEGLAILGHTGNNQILNKFGMNVSRNMEVISARVLGPPPVSYKGKTQRIQENTASWNLRGVQLPQGGNLKNWAVLVIKDGNRADFGGPDEIHPIIDMFVKMCRDSGITVSDNKPRALQPCKLTPSNFQQDPMREQAERELRQKLDAICNTPAKPGASKTPNFLLVMLSNDNKNVYNHLRTLVDCHYGIPTVCCQSEKIRKEKGQLQYLGNIALKANLKLGGRNHEVAGGALSFLGKDTMVLGGDVTHPTSKVSVRYTPSIAAVVASFENTYSLYPGSLRLQDSREEMIQYLDEQVAERLKLYVARNPSKKLPQRIIYFRDGVSESQYAQLNAKELPLIRKACAIASNNDPKYKPKIAIIVCGKRHHARFYPTKDKLTDNKGNSAPGTVIDRGVTTVTNLDFYLQAHVGLQGTARSAHYFVTHDELGFTANVLQELVHNMSYLFARATKAVSYAPPAYYADILCERGRCYIQGLLAGRSKDSSSDAPSTRSGGGGADKIAQRKAKAEAEKKAVMEEARKTWGNGPRPEVNGIMFFM
ncbi:Piwi-domain-containing protein [Wilcoxina mikolae CBS 423.85]|nr:Piwi-domain-containing protein [Wilcoxina mikolae CBS 423.85]